MDFVNNDTINVDSMLNRGRFAIEAAIMAHPLTLKMHFTPFNLTIDTGAEGMFNLVTSQGTINSIKRMKGIVYIIDNLLNNVSSSNLSGVFPEIENIGKTIQGMNGEVTIEGEAFAWGSALGDFKPLNDKLWIKAGPSVYAPLLYMPTQSVGFTGYGGGKLSLSNPVTYGIKTTGGVDAWTVQNDSISLGADLSAEARYAIWPILDAGMSVDNIPMVPAYMKSHYSFNPDLSFSLTVNPKDILSGKKPEIDTNIDDASSMFTRESGSSKMALRPLRFDWYALYKPFSSNTVIIKPNVGFSLKYPASAYAYTTVNWGVEADLNLPWILSIALGINRFEDTFNNTALLTLDFKAFAINIGAGLRGTTFWNSWTTNGLTAIANIKFGW
jgi:hypothetical protein